MGTKSLQEHQNVSIDVTALHTKIPVGYVFWAFVCFSQRSEENVPHINNGGQLNCDSLPDIRERKI